MGKEKKKLLVLTSTFPRWKNDTLPPFVYELSRRLTDKFDVTVLAPAYPGAKDYEVMDKMKVYRFHYFIRGLERLAGSGGILSVLKKNPLYYFVIPFFLLGEYLAAKKIVKEINPYTIHAHWIIPQGLIAYFIKKRFNVPYVVTSHGSDLMGIKNFYFIKKMILNNAKNITVVSSFLKEEVKKINKKLKVAMIPMGVDSKLFNPQKKDINIRKKYKIKGLFLLYVGRLSYEKGVDRLLECMPEVLKKNPKTKLMIIGEGPLEKKLKELVTKLNITNNIIFLGPINNKKLPKYYATADIFISLSRREGFGLTFVEAGMCGCWLIGPKVGGIKDIVNKKNGYFINKNLKEDTIKYAILKFIKKDKINKNNKYFLKKFDWEIIVKKYSDVFKK